MRGSGNCISGSGQHVTEQAATLGREVKGGNPEAFVPTDIVHNLSTGIVLHLNYSPHRRSSTRPQIRWRAFSPLLLPLDQFAFTCSRTCSRLPLRTCEAASQRVTAVRGLGTLVRDKVHVILYAPFQVPAVLLWGQPVQSPGGCSGRVFQTANSSKWVSSHTLLPVFI